MVCCNDIPSVINYGTSAVYKDLPSPEQVASGVVPLDSLPAAWWNAMWACNNVAFNCARTYIGQLVSELDTVLVQAGVCAECTCVNQLYQAITKLRRIVGDSTYPGAVKSSSCPGEVSIDANGVMTANCVGNAALLNTTAKNVVGAINELKSTYDTCWTNNTTALSGKAPTSHASTATTYGVGNATNYGHVKISDTYDSCVGAAADSIAASQKALYCVYSIASLTAAVGNTAGAALALNGSSGTCTTAARSDHVHPWPLAMGKSCCCQPGTINYQCSHTCFCICPSLTAPYTQISSSYYSCSSAGHCTTVCVTPQSIHFICKTSGLTACCSCIQGHIFYGNVTGNVTGNVIGNVTGCATRAGTATALVDCANTSCVVVRAEGGNELNFHSSGSWINYRGGNSSINIGDGNAAGGLGTVNAACFTGRAACAGEATKSDMTVYYSAVPSGVPAYLELKMGSSGDGFLSAGTHLYINGVKQCSKTIYIPIW